MKRTIGVVGLSLGAWLILCAPAACGGTWVTHLYMNNVRDLAVTDEGVWCATGGGALFYDFSLSGFRTWNRTADGLASDTLNAVAALTDGRIAFGTELEGVSVYDPRSGLWFSETSLTWPIAGDAILFIAETPPWRLIGSRGSAGRPGGFVALRNGEVREACQQGLDICGLPGWDVAAGIDHDGALWFGTTTTGGSLGGVGRLNYSTTEDWDTLNVGLPSLDVVGFASWNDSLYCGTKQGVSVWDGQRWTERDRGLPAEAVVSALRAGPTRLLLAASGVSGGVFSWDVSAGSWERLGTLQARCVAEGADGVVWAGASAELGGRAYLDSDEDGLWEYVGGEWIQHRQPGPHPVGSYTALTVDATGSLWAATSGRLRGWRIARHERDAWEFFDHTVVPGMNDTWVFDLRRIGEKLFVGHCCCPTPTSPCYMNIWDTGSNSVAVLDSVYNIQDSDVDDAGRIWFASLYESATGLAARGIYRHDPATGEWAHLSNESTGGLLLSNKVAAVEVESGYLWIGYYNEGLHRCPLGADGLPVMDSRLWAHFTADSIDSRLLNNGVRALAARAGQVWIGTTGGVTLWNQGAWRLFRPSSGGLPGSDVTDIALTDDGSAWIGIRGSGVTRIQKDAGGVFRFERFAPPELVSAAVTVLTPDSDGRSLWVGTDAGLSRYSPGGTTEVSGAAEIKVYPNPYNPACATPLRILSLPGRAAKGTICNPAGKVMARFENAWEGETVWDGRDEQGRLAAPGLYVIRVTTPRGWLTGRVAVLDLPCAQ